MPSYFTLSEAVNDLQRRGYTDTLQPGGHCVVCNEKGKRLDRADFHIDKPA